MCIAARVLKAKNVRRCGLLHAFVCQPAHEAALARWSRLWPRSIVSSVTCFGISRVRSVRDCAWNAVVPVWTTILIASQPASKVGIRQAPRVSNPMAVSVVERGAKSRSTRFFRTGCGVSHRRTRSSSRYRIHHVDMGGTSTDVCLSEREPERKLTHDGGFPVARARSYSYHRRRWGSYHDRRGGLLKGADSAARTQAGSVCPAACSDSPDAKWSGASQPQVLLGSHAHAPIAHTGE